MKTVFVPKTDGLVILGYALNRQSNIQHMNQIRSGTNMNIHMNFLDVLELRCISPVNPFCCGRMLDNFASKMEVRIGLNS